MDNVCLFINQKEEEHMRLISILLLALVIVGCSPSNSASLPKTFGFYLQTAQGAREIQRNNDPALRAAASRIQQAGARKDVKGIQSATREFLKNCPVISERPVFILYHETTKPEEFVLRDDKRNRVELGVAPVEGKQHMYTLSPKLPLSKGLYMLSIEGNFGSQYFPENYSSCYLSNMTIDQLLSSSGVTKY